MYTDALRGLLLAPFLFFHTAAAQKTPKNAKRIEGVAAYGEDAEHHEHQIKRGHDPKRFAYPHIRGGPEIPHQFDCERRADHGPAAESNDGHSGGEPGAIGKPE
jgi:hypothetical protein